VPGAPGDNIGATVRWGAPDRSTVLDRDPTATCRLKDRFLPSLDPVRRNVTSESPANDLRRLANRPVPSHPARGIM
jgi:hypothetical protein